MDIACIGLNIVVLGSLGALAVGASYVLSKLTTTTKTQLSTYHHQLSEFGLQPTPLGDASGTLAGKPAWVGELTNPAGVLCALRVEQLPIDLALRNKGPVPKQVRSGDPRLDKSWTLSSRKGGIGRLHLMVRDGLIYLDRYAHSIALHEGILEVTCKTPDQLLHALAIVRTLIPLLQGDAIIMLADRAQNDPTPGVRAQMLWQLAQVDRDKAQIVAASRDTTEDWGPEELMLMGELLEDRHCLMRAITHADSRSSISVRAAKSWIKIGGDAGPAIRAVAAAHGMGAIIEMAQHLEALPEPPIDALLPYVPAVLDRTKTRDPELRQRALVALCSALEIHPSPAGATALLRVFYEGTGNAQLRALGAIRRIGTIEEVGTLRAVHDGLPVTEFGLKAAIDTAIKEIQGRTSGDIGALSLTTLDDGSGALSEVPPTDG